MIKVIVCGGCGRMASKVAQLIYQDNKLKLTGIVESSSHPDVGKGWGVTVGQGKTEIMIIDDLEALCYFDYSLISP
ncbi:hypothetical protein ES705_46153 [subsurface metagenome]